MLEYRVLPEPENSMAAKVAARLFAELLLGIRSGAVRHLEEVYFRDGIALFGRESREELQDFRDYFDDELAAISDNGVAKLLEDYWLRKKNVGHIERFEWIEIDSAVVEAFSREISDKCSDHVGMVSSVLDLAKSRRRLVCWTGSVEGLASELKRPDRAFPPYYFGCRCELSAMIPGADIRVSNSVMN